MTPGEILDGLKKDIEKNISITGDTFIPLSNDQLNWKPTPEKWSISQCLEHLNIVDKYYLVRFRKVLISGKKAFFNRDHYTPSLLGSYYIKQVEPNAPVKNSQTHKIYRPSEDKNDGSVLKEFVRLQHLLKETFEKAKKYDMKKNKFSMPSNELMVFRFADAMIAIVRHDQRHMLQALMLMDMDNFPKQ